MGWGGVCGGGRAVGGSAGQASWHEHGAPGSTAAAAHQAAHNPAPVNASLL